MSEAGGTEEGRSLGSASSDCLPHHEPGQQWMEPTSNPRAFPPALLYTYSRGSTACNTEYSTDCLTICSTTCSFSRTLNFGPGFSCHLIPFVRGNLHPLGHTTLYRIKPTRVSAPRATHHCQLPLPPQDQERNVNLYTPFTFTLGLHSCSLERRQRLKATLLASFSLSADRSFAF